MFDYSIVEPIELKPSHYTKIGRGRYELCFNDCEVARQVRLAKDDFPTRTWKKEPPPIAKPQTTKQKPKPKKPTFQILPTTPDDNPSLWQEIRITPAPEATIHEAINAVERFEKKDPCLIHLFHCQSNNAEQFRLVCPHCNFTLLLPGRTRWTQAFNDWLSHCGKTVAAGLYQRNYSSED